MIVRTNHASFMLIDARQRQSSRVKFDWCSEEVPFQIMYNSQWVQDMVSVRSSEKKGFGKMIISGGNLMVNIHDYRETE